MFILIVLLINTLACDGAFEDSPWDPLGLTLKAFDAKKHSSGFREKEQKSRSKTPYSRMNSSKVLAWPRDQSTRGFFDEKLSPQSLKFQGTREVPKFDHHNEENDDESDDQLGFLDDKKIKTNLFAINPHPLTIISPLTMHRSISEQSLPSFASRNHRRCSLDQGKRSDRARSPYVAWHVPHRSFPGSKCPTPRRKSLLKKRFEGDPASEEDEHEWEVSDGVGCPGRECPGEEQDFENSDDDFDLLFKRRQPKLETQEIRDSEDEVWEVDEWDFESLEGSQNGSEDGSSAASF